MIDNHLQTDLSTHREQLFRWFVKQVGDVQAAEDLTQETLVEAWNNRYKLTDPSGVTAWLYAIASNIHKRWLRQNGRDQARYTPLSEETFSTSSLTSIDLSRTDLITLLDRALAELPPETRTVVLMRYLEELPQAKVAQILGLSESAVAVRLHRGKLELRRRLQLEADGEISQQGWQKTNIWCPVCGIHCYEGKLDSHTGELMLWCPRCFPDSRFPDWGHTETPEQHLIKGLTSFKPALNRVMKNMADHLIPALPQGKIRCETCGTETPLYRTYPSHVPRFQDDHPGIHYTCPKCAELSYSALSGIAISTPEARQFWKDHPRIQQQPIQRAEHEGQSVIIFEIASIADPKARLAVFFAQESFELLKVERTDKHHD